jgi:hypothetical protein
MSSLNLSDDALREVVYKAILDTISADQRDTLLKAALAHLMSPGERDGFGGHRPSPLQTAFNDAVSRYAREAAYERLQNDAEWKAQIDALLGDVLKAFAGERRGKAVEALADAMTKALTGERY